MITNSKNKIMSKFKDLRLEELIKKIEFGDLNSGRVNK